MFPPAPPERGLGRSKTWASASSGVIRTTEDLPPRRDLRGSQRGGNSGNRPFSKSVNLDTIKDGSVVDQVWHDQLVEWEEARVETVLKEMDQLEFRTHEVLRTVGDAVPELLLVRTFVECLFEAQEQLATQLLKKTPPKVGEPATTAHDFHFNTLEALEETDRVMERRVRTSLVMLQELVDQLDQIEHSITSLSMALEETVKSSIATMDTHQTKVSQAWENYTAVVAANTKQQPFFQSSDRNKSGSKKLPKPKDVWLAEWRYRVHVYKQSQSWGDAALQVNTLSNQLLQIESTRRSQMCDWMVDLVQRQQRLSNSLEMAAAMGQMMFLLGMQQEHQQQQQLMAGSNSSSTTEESKVSTSLSPKNNKKDSKSFSEIPKLVLGKVADSIPTLVPFDRTVIEIGSVQCVTLVERWAVTVDDTGMGMMLGDDPIVSMAVLTLAGLLHVFDFTKEQFAALSLTRSTVAEAWKTLVDTDLELYGMVEPSLSLPMYEYRASIVDDEDHIVELRKMEPATGEDDTGTTDEADDDDIRDRLRLPTEEAMNIFVRCFDFDS